MARMSRSCISDKCLNVNMTDSLWVFFAGIMATNFEQFALDMIVWCTICPEHLTSDNAYGWNSKTYILCNMFYRLFKSPIYKLLWIPKGKWISIWLQLGLEYGMRVNYFPHVLCFLDFVLATDFASFYILRITAHYELFISDNNAIQHILRSHIIVQYTHFVTHMILISNANFAFFHSLCHIDSLVVI